ncbi:hypothetical protein OTU49_009516 [Cherax quadricarinatus]|uniref:BZIP domain-containing protein n=1 Tax=Cherax quadricarinatus TaxID=27406 RepID=A0AAW0WJS9_CHEQU
MKILQRSGKNFLKGTAAIRCREKKKKWIENLSIKYDELGSINQKLQNEVSSLRSEVAVLKSMLLQHKDCPVTLAMQGDGSVESMNCSRDLTPLPPILAPLTEGVHISCQSPLKPRARSLSLPSIPSSSSTTMEPLPVNLSCTTCAAPPTSTVVTSVSSSTKVTMMGAPEIISAEISPKALVMSGTSSMIVAASGSPVTHTSALGQSQLLNLTLHQAHQVKPPSVLRKSN